MKFEKIKEKIKQNKKLIPVLFLGIFGILLLLLSSMFDSGQSAKEADLGNQPEEVQSGFLSSAEAEELLETKLKKLLEAKYGEGNVSVMIALASSCEYEYAQNEKTQDSADASSADREVILYSGDGGAEEGLIIRIKNPDLLGVAVLCYGGDSSLVKTDITNLIKSLFGIGSNRIYVGSKP